MVAERVWLVHRGGFAGARVLRAGMPGAEGVENLPEGKCRVKLEHGGEMLDVDEEDVEKVDSCLRLCYCCYNVIYFFSVLTLLDVSQEGHVASKQNLGWLDSVVVMGLGVVIERSQVRLPAAPLPDSNTGQVVHTHVLLSLTYHWYATYGAYHTSFAVTPLSTSQATDFV